MKKTKFQVVLERIEANPKIIGAVSIGVGAVILASMTPVLMGVLAANAAANAAATIPAWAGGVGGAGVGSAAGAVASSALPASVAHSSGAAILSGAGGYIAGTIGIPAMLVAAIPTALVAGAAATGYFTLKSIAAAAAATTSVAIPVSAIVLGASLVFFGSYMILKDYKVCRSFVKYLKVKIWDRVMKAVEKFFGIIKDNPKTAAAAITTVGLGVGGSAVAAGTVSTTATVLGSTTLGSIGTTLGIVSAPAVWPVYVSIAAIAGIAGIVVYNMNDDKKPPSSPITDQPYF